MCVAYAAAIATAPLFYTAYMCSNQQALKVSHDVLFTVHHSAVYIARLVGVYAVRFYLMISSAHATCPCIACYGLFAWHVWKILCVGAAAHTQVCFVHICIGFGAGVLQCGLCQQLLLLAAFQFYLVDVSQR